MTEIEDIKVSLVDFIDDRDLSQDKIDMLKFLEKRSDNFHIIKRNKGRSIAVCEFDCGAYKGSQILQFMIKNLNPFLILFDLENLTSGHIHKFGEVKNSLINYMNQY